MNNQKNMNEDNNEEEQDHPVLDNQYSEETAAEIVDPDVKDNEHHDQDVKNVYGWISIALSVISFFLIPILFAGAGIILGFVARNREAPILGNTAITIGIVSILVRLLIIPLI